MRRVSAYGPGRVELLGNHTDYNLGLVLAAAIDRGVTVSGHTRSDGTIRLESKTLDRVCESSVDILARDDKEPWANYALGVTRELLRAGYAVAGYDATIESDLALGGGLSSSAGFEVAIACFLVKLYGFEIEPRDIARLCCCAENEFVGVASGLLDQLTSLLGRADHALYIDCASHEVRTVPFPADLSLVIANTGAQRRLVQSNYNQRREECIAAAAALGVGNLRAVSLPHLECSRSAIDDVLYRRALHVVGENDRVARAVDYLVSGEKAKFGALMNASHESSRSNFENSTPELDLLVEIARSLPGVFGARLTGGGFGGSIVTLVKSAEAAAIADHLARYYLVRTGREADAFVCRLADGAAIGNAL